MTAFLNSCFDPLDCEINTIEPKKQKHHFIAFFLSCNHFLLLAFSG